MILDVARRLFSEEGYEGTTLEMVASELGVTRPALYHWLPSKESLLCDIHEEGVDLLVERLSRIMKSDAPPLEKLANAIRSHVSVVTENLQTIAVFFQEEASLPAEAAARIASRKRRYDRSLIDLMKAAQLEGSIRNDLNPRIAVELILGMCNWLYHWYEPRGRVRPEQLADQIMAIAFDGLRAR